MSDAATPAGSGEGTEVARWARLATFILAIAGVGIAAYLTVAHYTSPTVLACSGNGLINCEQVTTSRQSVLFGVPVALAGLFYFAGMAVLCSPQAWRARSEAVRVLRLVGVWSSMAMVAWLVYAELHLIHAICLWCTFAHIVAFILFGLVVLYGAPGPSDVQE